MKKRLSLFTLMLLVASFLLSVNLSTVSSTSVGMRVVPNSAPCIGLYANDPDSPGYEDNVVTFNPDGSMSFDFTRGFNAESSGFQPGSRYEWSELFFIENLKNRPLQYRIINDGLKYISVEDSRTSQRFINNAVTNDIWETIRIGETTAVRVYFEIAPDAPLEAINGILTIVTDCNGNDNDDSSAITSPRETSSIHLEKTADVTFARPGDIVTYTFIVRNTGNDILTNITLVDSVLGEITLNKTTLVPGEEAIGTITYIVKDEDLPGPLVNSASVIGYTSDGKVESTDEVSILLNKHRNQEEPSRASEEPRGPQLPKTGGAALPYLAGGFVLAVIGLYIKRRL